jgi:glycosyltransferase involved in cell wall biosynthesis
MEEVLRIGLISSYIPKKCGIATYSRDLIEAIEKQDKVNVQWRLVAAEDNNESHSYDGKEIAILKKNSLKSYKNAARILNKWAPDIVLFEHEYGLYGGSWADVEKDNIAWHVPTGDYILELIDKITAPIVTTLHTIVVKPDVTRQAVICNINKCSSKLIAMTNDTRNILKSQYGISVDDIEVIPHGVPQVNSRNKKISKMGLGLNENSFYLLVTGLINNNKGIDIIIRALPSILKKHHKVVLLVVGQTHPDVLAAEGELYRKSLINLAQELGVDGSLQFVNEYLPTEKLVDYFMIADIYLTIHKDPEQAASGTLAYALGCGLVAISTPYRYANEVLSEGRGLLVPFNSPSAIAKCVNMLIEDKVMYKKTKHKATLFGKLSSWPKVAETYMKVIKGAIKE